MTTSKTLSALIGPTLVAMAVSMLVNHAALSAMVEQVSREPFLILFSGVVTFVVGLAIIRVHNIWEVGWPVVVTILGWLFLIGGLVRILFPTRLAAIAAGFAQNTGFMIGEAIVLLVLGAFLSYKGYSEG